MTTPELPPLPEPFHYPEGVVFGPCACGSWPGGECLRCTPINFYTMEQAEVFRSMAAQKGTA